MGSNKFSRCSCRGRDNGGGEVGETLARLSRIITAPATINTTAMTNQIMLRTLPTATISNHLLTPSRQHYRIAAVET